MFRLFIIGLLGTTLAACTTITKEKTVTDESHEQWQKRQYILQPLQQWSIRGRVALFVDEKVYNLGLAWKRNGQDSTIKLEASFGQGVILLEKQTTRTSLTTSSGEHFSGIQAEQVLHQATGLVIPVEGLEAWVKGIPHLSTTSTPDIDAAGLAKTIEQDGWWINYLKYEKTDMLLNGDLVLPRKMYMKRDNMAIKIVIDQWQPDTSPPEPALFPQF